MNKITAVADHVIVEVYSEPTTTESGLTVIKEPNPGSPERGRVISAGPKAEGIAKGDEVLIARTGTNLEISGQKVRVLRSHDILATLR